MSARVAGTLFVLAALLALVLGEPGRAWGAYLVNLLFWWSLAAGAVALSAAITLCNGRWADRLQELAENWLRAMLICLALFLALPLGAEALYVWVGSPVPGLESWLAPLSLFGRDGVAMAVLVVVAWRYVSARQQRRGRWAVALLITFAVVETLLAADLVMSLEPRWNSTLFGPYFFIAGAYAALASLAPMAVSGRIELSDETFHDLGNLLFGFCLLWTYLFWSQFLVIWYGNLPKETGVLLAHVSTTSWRVWSWLVLLACFVGPFVLLLVRSVKRHPKRLAAVSLLPLIGVWAERYLLVMPSVRPDATWPIGWVELAVSLGFGSLVAWSLPRRPRRADDSDQRSASGTISPQS